MKKKSEILGSCNSKEENSTLLSSPRETVEKLPLVVREMDGHAPVSGSPPGAALPEGLCTYSQCIISSSATNMATFQSLPTTKLLMKVL